MPKRLEVHLAAKKLDPKKLQDIPLNDPNGNTPFRRVRANLGAIEYILQDFEQLTAFQAPFKSDKQLQQTHTTASNLYHDRATHKLNKHQSKTQDDDVLVLDVLEVLHKTPLSLLLGKSLIGGQRRLLPDAMFLAKEVLGSYYRIGTALCNQLGDLKGDKSRFIHTSELFFYASIFKYINTLPEEIIGEILNLEPLLKATVVSVWMNAHLNFIARLLYMKDGYAFTPRLHRVFRGKDSFILRVAGESATSMFCYVPKRAFKKTGTEDQHIETFKSTGRLASSFEAPRETDKQTVSSFQCTSRWILARYTCS